MDERAPGQGNEDLEAPDGPAEGHGEGRFLEIEDLDNLPDEIRENLLASYVARLLKEHNIEFTDQDINDTLVLEPEALKKYLEAILRTEGVQEPQKFMAEREIFPKLPSDIEEAIASKPNYARHKENLLKDERAKKVTVIILRRLDEMYDDVVRDTGIDSSVQEKWRAAIEAEAMNMVIAYDDNGFIGRVNILWTGPEEGVLREKIGNIPMIKELHVNGDYREIGIGIRLMLACEYLLKSRREEHPEIVSNLGLLVDPGHTAARNLFSKLGYWYADANLYETTLQENGQQVATRALLMAKGVEEK